MPCHRYLNDIFITDSIQTDFVNAPKRYLKNVSIKHLQEFESITHHKTKQSKEYSTTFLSCEFIQFIFIYSNWHSRYGVSLLLSSDTLHEVSRCYYSLLSFCKIYFYLCVDLILMCRALWMRLSVANTKHAHTRTQTVWRRICSTQNDRINKCWNVSCILFGW